MSVHPSTCLLRNAESTGLLRVWRSCLFRYRPSDLAISDRLFVNAREICCNRGNIWCQYSPAPRGNYLIREAKTSLWLLRRKPFVLQKSPSSYSLLVKWWCLKSFSKAVLDTGMTWNLQPIKSFTAKQIWSVLSLSETINLLCQNVIRFWRIYKQ